MEETYFADRVNKAILMAPCIFTNMAGVDVYEQIFPDWRYNAVYLYNGPNWDNNIQAICESDHEHS